MTLSFNTHIPSLPISCLYLTTFRTQAAIDYENPLFTLFPIEKPMLQNLTLP